MLWARGEQRALLTLVARFLTLPLASLEPNWIQTRRMVRWIAQCMKNWLNQWFSIELAESYWWYSLGADTGASVV